MAAVARGSGSGSSSRRPCTRSDGGRLGETGPLSQGVQAGGKARRKCHINGMAVRKKRPRGFKPEPPISFSPVVTRRILQQQHPKHQRGPRRLAAEAAGQVGVRDLGGENSQG